MKYYRYYRYPLIYLSIIKVKIIPFREKVAGSSISLVFVVLLFLNLYLPSGSAFAQSDSIQNSILNTRVTLSLQNTPIEKILDTLSSYPNVKFSYVNYDLPLQDKINIHTKDQQLTILLDSIFRPYGIKYYIVSKQIVLKKEKKAIGLKNNFLASSSNRKISVSFYGSIGSSYRSLRSNNPALIDTRNSDEKAISNFAAGTYISYQYFPSIIFRSGISLFNTGEKGSFTTDGINIDSILPGNNGNGSGSGNGNGNGNNLDTITSIISQNSYTYKNKYNFLNIPLMVGYTFGKQKLHVSTFVGFGLGFFLNYSTTFPFNINEYQTNPTNPQISSIYQKDPRTHTYRKIALTIPLLAEIEYPISNDLGIFGAAGANYFVSSIYTSKEHVKYNPYYFNLAIGLTYHLTESAK